MGGRFSQEQESPGVCPLEGHLLSFSERKTTADKESAGDSYSMISANRLVSKNY